MKSPPCFSATARNHASPGVREGEGTTPRAKVQVGGLLDVIEQHLRDRRDRRSYLSRYLRGSAFEGPETWSEWQDLDLRPLVPNAMRSLAAFEKSAIFVTFEDVCSPLVAGSAFSVLTVLDEPHRGMSEVSISVVLGIAQPEPCTLASTAPGAHAALHGTLAGTLQIILGGLASEGIDEHGDSL